MTERRVKAWKCKCETNNYHSKTKLKNGECELCKTKEPSQGYVLLPEKCINDDNIIFDCEDVGCCPKCGAEANDDPLIYDTDKEGNGIVKLDGDFIYYPFTCKKCGARGNEYHMIQYSNTIVRKS